MIPFCSEEWDDLRWKDSAFRKNSVNIWKTKKNNSSNTYGTEISFYEEGPQKTVSIKTREKSWLVSPFRGF